MPVERGYAVKAGELKSSARAPGPFPGVGASLPRQAEAMLRAAELRLRPPGCFLVTGYRGVGKSTFIKLLAALAEGTGERFPVVVVEVNGAVTGADEERPRFLLRKLQRNLYLELAERGLVERLERRVQLELRLAYLQTAYTVTEKSRVTWEMAASLERQGWVDRAVIVGLATALAQALPLLTRSVTMLRMPESWLAALGETLRLPYWLAAVLAPTLLALLTFKASAAWNRVREQETVSRYDDEVAEATFIDLLGSLSRARIRPEARWRRAWRAWRSSTGPLTHRLGLALKGFLSRRPSLEPVKLIFVIDELDKLEGTNGEEEGGTSVEFDDLVRGLKPILLCGHAHFLLISGMEDFHRWYSASAAEDDKFVNLFSGHFHVPAMRDEELGEIFRGLFVHDQDADSETMQLFCQALLLRSRGRPRQFLNEFARHVDWNAGPEIRLSDYEAEGAVVDAKLYRALAQAWKTVQTWRLPAGIEDTLRTRLILMLLWMGRRPGGQFSRTEVLAELGGHRLPQEFQRYAQDGADLLLEAMASDGLLIQTEPGQYLWQVWAEGSHFVRPTERRVKTTLSTGAMGVTTGAMPDEEEEIPPPEDGEELAWSLLADAAPELVEEAETTRLLSQLAEETELPPQVERARRRLMANPGDWAARVDLHLYRVLKHRLGWRVDPKFEPLPGKGFERTFGLRDGAGHPMLFTWLVAGEVPMARRWVAEIADYFTSRPNYVREQVRAHLLIFDPRGTVPTSGDSVSLISLPFPFMVTTVRELRTDGLVDVLRDQPHAPWLPQRREIDGRAGDGYVYLQWRARPPERYQILRTTRLGDPRARQTLPVEWDGEFCDVTVENGVTYFYTLLTSEDHFVAGAAVMPASWGEAKDSRYWRGMLMEAAKRPLVAAEESVEAVPLDRLRKALLSLHHEERPGALWDQSLKAACEAMQLVTRTSDGTLRLTAAGREVVQEEAEGPAFYHALIQHPAVRRLVRTLRAHGRLHLSEPTYAGRLLKGNPPPENEWLHEVISQTGALVLQEQTVFWNPPK